MFEIVLRVVVVYLFLMGVFRLIGKRELSKLSPFELVTLMLVPAVFSRALIGVGSLTVALLAASTLFLLVIVSSSLAYVYEPVHRALSPAPTVLVEEGKLLERALHNERIDPDELYGEMHRQGYFSLSQVKYAILESGGHISIIPNEHVAH